MNQAGWVIGSDLMGTFKYVHSKLWSIPALSNLQDTQLIPAASRLSWKRSREYRGIATSVHSCILHMLPCPVFKLIFFIFLCTLSWFIKRCTFGFSKVIFAHGSSSQLPPAQTYIELEPHKQHQMALIVGVGLNHFSCWVDRPDLSLASSVPLPLMTFPTMQEVMWYALVSPLSTCSAVVGFKINCTVFKMYFITIALWPYSLWGKRQLPLVFVDNGRFRQLSDRLPVLAVALRHWDPMKKENVGQIQKQMMYSQSKTNRLRTIKIALKCIGVPLVIS